MKITTNNKRRPIDRNEDGEPFFFYRGMQFLLSEIIRFGGPWSTDAAGDLEGWHGHTCDGYVVVKIADDGDSVIVGRMTS